MIRTWLSNLMVRVLCSIEIPSVFDATFLKWQGFRKDIVFRSFGQSPIRPLTADFFWGRPFLKADSQLVKIMINSITCRIYVNKTMFRIKACL